MDVQTTENADSLPFDIVMRDGSALAFDPPER